MKTAIHSEIGELEAVIIHTPGSEVENMTPENAERALYSDILNLSIASKEYAQLKGVLQKIANVYEIKDLLTEILENEVTKKSLIDEICNFEKAGEIAPMLLDTEAGKLANMLVEGVVLEKNNLTNFLSNERFLLRPLHNLFFTRDSAMGLNDNILIGRMANPVRERETLIMEAVFSAHILFETNTLNPLKPKNGILKNHKSTIEGGDFQVANENVFVIGTGIRTSTQGIDFIIENIKREKETPHHIIVQELPATPESFIHLDMIFTFLDRNDCMVYEPVILGTTKYRTIHIYIENQEVKKIEEEQDILTALKKLGIDLKPISCGGKEDLWFQEREQWHSGANFFAFAPGKIIGYERNVHTVDELNKNGYEVLRAADVISGIANPMNYNKCIVTIQGSELARGGGGARCMTMPVKRQKIVW